MTSSIIAAVVLIGFAAGLRALTAPALVAWCAYLGCIDLAPTPFAFMSSWITVAILTLFALGEYVGDLLPSAPNRTAFPGLIARIVTGSFSAACLLAANGTGLAFSIIGGIAAVAGAYAGLQIRLRLVEALKTKDAFVAIPEDLVAIAISIAAVCLAGSSAI